jgi:hypothetical protein
VTDWLSRSAAPTLIRPQRSLGGIVFDVVIEEIHEDSLAITEHPVERGAPISDHAYLKPRTVTIRGGAGDAGSSLDLSGASASGERRSIALYEQLLKLQAEREPIEIVTGKRSYKDMLVETVATTTEAGAVDTLMVTADCREVIIVETRTTSIPPRSRHADGAKTGGISDKGSRQLQADKRSAIAEAAGGSGHRRPGGPVTGGDE